MRSSTRLRTRAGDAVLAERELVVQAVGTRHVELQRARVVGEVGELARREMPDERSGAHPQEGLDRRRHRRASVHCRTRPARAKRSAELRWAP